MQILKYFSELGYMVEMFSIEDQIFHPDHIPCILKDFGDSSFVCVCNSTYCDTVDDNVRVSKSKFSIFTSTKLGDRLSHTYSDIGKTITGKNSSLSCMQRDFGEDSVVCVCNSTYCDTVDANVRGDEGQYSLYLTDSVGDRIVHTYGSINSQNMGATTYTVNKNVTYQEIIGFGGAFTDAAGINIGKLSLGAQTNLLKSYYSPSGIEYNVGRIPMASCDFSTHPYSYDDSSGDFNLTKFALTQEDINYKIKYIQMANQMSKQNLTLFGSPWSAPAWMKTNQNMTGKGTLIGEPGGKYFKTWAMYFVRFIQEYAKHSIKLWGITGQNEPTDGNIFKFPFQAMGWTAEMQRDFIAKDLGPALEQNGLGHIKLMILDDSRLMLPYWPEKVFESQEASKYISGIAVHWYEDLFVPANVLSITHSKFPDKFILATEACTGEAGPLDPVKVSLGNWKRGEEYAHDIIQVFESKDASKYISGIAVHWYQDKFVPATVLSITHKKFPDKFILATEACSGAAGPLDPVKVRLGNWERAEDYAHDIMQDLQNWVTGWTDWNIALDMQGGPNWVKNFVDSPVIVNSDKDEFYKQPMYYILGHFSKFIVPGSKRLDLTVKGSNKNVEVVAFLRPDSSIVAVLLNRSDEEVLVSLRDLDLGYINIDMIPHCIQTVTWWQN
ncbi:hypothetical protein FSP39_012333 [Pinctada imbricata]|uniref:Glucosylceramidase n=1 Tax=Pinctada imbricata TaxID=66713 RepID=A0AA88Y8X3_PINIB|nr:hypothetical protein FSP39_012333 [Pinctada imbricata]